MANSREQQFIEQRFLSEFRDWKNPAAYSFWALVRCAAHKHAESIRFSSHQSERSHRRAAGLLQSAERATRKIARLIPQVKELR